MLPSSRSRYSAKRRPVPVDPVLERGQRHALDLGHHPADVVGVGSPERGEGEPAVAADDRGDAVHVRRRGQRVPEQLGVVVGVGVDEAGGDHQPVASNVSARGLVGPRRRPRCARRARRRRRRRRARPCRRRWSLPNELVEHAVPRSASNLTTVRFALLSGRDQVGSAPSDGDGCSLAEDSQIRGGQRWRWRTRCT